MHFATKRQSSSPIRRLQQDRQEFFVGERSDRHLDSDLVMTMKNDIDTTRLKTFDRGVEQISGRALHDVFDESPEPTAIRLPLAAGVVHELDVGRSTLKLGRNQPCLWIGDGTAARQRQ